MGRPVRVKICGITSWQDADDAVAAGADAIGLNFYPASPRYVSVEDASQIVRRLPPFIDAVAVLVRLSVEQALASIAALQMRCFQIHGSDPEVLDVFPCRYIPTFQVRGQSDLSAIDRYLEACRQTGCLPAAVLVDGHAPGLVGGTGQRAPWDLLAGWRPAVPLILAGGLTPENVAEAVRRVRPWAVDVASGVERAPGIKDADKVRRFVEEARSAG